MGKAWAQVRVKSHGPGITYQIKLEIVKLRVSGITSIRALTEALNKRQVATAAGGQWHVQPVHRLIQRIDAQPDLRAAS